MRRSDPDSTEDSQVFQPSVRRVRGVFALALLLVASMLAACSSGGDSGGSGEAKTPAEIARDLAGDDDSGDDPSPLGDADGGDPTSDRGGERTGSIEFLVPESADAPNGFTMIDTACEAEDDLFGGHIVYAIPDSWEVEGRGAADTTITLDGDVDHRFGSPDGTVTIAFAQDNREGLPLLALVQAAVATDLDLHKFHCPRQLPCSLRIGFAQIRAGGTRAILAGADASRLRRLATGQGPIRGGHGAVERGTSRRKRARWGDPRR